jgi:hypothetical protein
MEWFITAAIILSVIGLAFLHALVIIQFIFGVLND